ncbi:hypothetical protein GSS87_05825 [Corynebacterium sp. 4HC-13]|uniref:Uncharacterized protein n=1 Tax=Corynebacterium anserum TaxID=2684406 RepID=A0A7G7YR59_9CORY|nr:hypothetical protein [Corynebacterium anserum]QNH96979.1 hypothetical protein GP473_06200 [Corynebacterium anserum]
MSRTITGGLVGFAVVLTFLGHSAWVAHIIGAGIACVSVAFASRCRHRGERAGIWILVPFVTAVALYFYAWF